MGGSSKWSSSLQMSTSTSKGHLDSRYFYAGFTKANTATTLEVKQVITIDAGVTIDLGAYVKVFNPSSVPANQPQPSVRITLLFDDVVRDTYDWTRTTGGSYQLLEAPNSFVVGAGRSHTVKIKIEANNYNSGSTTPLFTADDFYVNVVRGPNDRPLCRVTQSKAVF
jgi:hypothetical protein